MPISHVNLGAQKRHLTTPLSCLTPPGMSEAGIPNPKPIVALLLFTLDDRTPGSELGRPDSGEASAARSPELGELSGLIRLF